MLVAFHGVLSPSISLLYNLALPPLVHLWYFNLFFMDQFKFLYLFLLATPAWMPNGVESGHTMLVVKANILLFSLILLLGFYLKNMGRRWVFNPITSESVIAPPQIGCERGIFVRRSWERRQVGRVQAKTETECCRSQRKSRVGLDRNLINMVGEIWLELFKLIPT